MEFNLRLYKSFYQYELYIFQHAKFNILGMHLVDTILEIQYWSIPQGSKKKKKFGSSNLNFYSMCLENPKSL